MLKLLRGAATAVVATYVIVALGSPRPRGDGATLDGLEAELRARDLHGRELADAAIVAVACAMPYHSALHLWERPTTALRRGRGWSHQYNGVLAELLRRLGFQVRLVHAARVRGFGYPWVMSGHAWVKVRLDKRDWDACASSARGALGHTLFTPLTRELPLRPQTRLLVPIALSPFVIWSVWRAWLTGQEVPAWVFGQRVQE